MTRRATHAFTLVELLVVIGIISILAAMLLPTLQESRLIARRTACASSLHQTLLSVQMYSEDCREFPMNMKPSDSLWLQDGFYAAPCFAGREGVPSHWRGLLIQNGYAKNRRALGCPSGIPRGYRQHWGMGNFVESDNDADIWAGPPYSYFGQGVDCARAAGYHTGLWVNDRTPRSF
jgi:prepilin-type N-terminal cleavage/methylation domain-containing protein